MSKFLDGILGNKVFMYRDIPKFTRPQLWKSEPEVMDGKSNSHCHDSNDTKDGEERINDIASAWGFDVIPVVGDGNCLFTAVAMQLVAMIETTENTALNSHLYDIGIDQALSVTEAAKVLRCKVVEELQGERMEFYQEFLPANLDLYSEADSFRESGTFASAGGDLIPLAIANLIQVPIFILNPNVLTPFITISPYHIQPTDQYVILAYNPNGPGHYDALIPNTKERQKNSSGTSSRSVNYGNCSSEKNLLNKDRENNVQRKPCRCGEKKKYSIKKETRTYKGRCKCIEEYGSCMSSCYCQKFCQGVACGGNDRCDVVKKQRTPRKRSLNLNNAVKAKRSKIALEENEEKVKDAGLNALEFFVMYAIIIHSRERRSLCDIYSCSAKYIEIIQLINSLSILAILPIYTHSMVILCKEKKKIEKSMKP